MIGVIVLLVIAMIVLFVKVKIDPNYFNAQSDDF